MVRRLTIGLIKRKSDACPTWENVRVDRARDFFGRRYLLEKDTRFGRSSCCGGRFEENALGVTLKNVKIVQWNDENRKN